MKWIRFGDNLLNKDEIIYFEPTERQGIHSIGTKLRSGEYFFVCYESEKERNDDINVLWGQLNE